MWVLRVPRCHSCRFPLQPTGRCANCGAHDAPHSMAWGQYYKEAEREQRLRAMSLAERLLPWFAVGLLFIVLAWVLAV